MTARGNDTKFEGQREDPNRGWADRVAFADVSGGPVAYRPHEVVSTRPAEAVAVLQRRWPEAGISWRRGENLDPYDESGIGRLDKVPDPVAAVDELRLSGISATVNNVFFAHCGGCCPPHPAIFWGANPAFANPAFANPAFANPAFANPAFANPAFANPAFANPAFANPAFANPAFANPAFANPAFANPAFANPADPFRATGLRRSSARPAQPDAERTKDLLASLAMTPASGSPKVVVLDTGLAGIDEPHAMAGAPAITGDFVDQPDSDGNKLLDGAAGHGTFIAGLINQITPGCAVEVHQVLRSYGDGDEATIVDAINNLPRDKDTILNLSFGGYVWDAPFALARAVRKFQDDGGVVVSSAGNDASCQPTYPAALPGVVSVGAVGPTGPAAFTNYGPWIRACAPGVDLVSTFFEGFKGAARPGPDGDDPDNFSGWARWSGTSFAAPVVVAALAREMMRMAAAERSAKAAVAQLIDAPTLLRLPNLGTVVNVA